MSGNDSIQVINSVRVQNIERKLPQQNVSQKSDRKHPKHRLVQKENTLFDQVKNYLKFARDINTHKWVAETKSYSTLYKKL